MGVASGSGWNLWVWLLGVVVRRYIDFLILLIPTPPSLLFVHFFYSFFTIIRLEISHRTRWWCLKCVDNVPSAKYSSVFNVLRLWSVSLIPTYSTTDSMIL